MKTFDKQKWSQIRVRGHARFVVRVALRSGLPVGILATFGPWLFAVLTHSTTPSPWMMAFLFICFGVAFGYLRGEREWKQGERAYHENAA
jgi:hypothetical protein